MTEEGREQMIGELKKAVTFFHEVDATLEPLTMQIIEAKGVDKHIPEAMEGARQVGFGEPLPGL